MQAALTALACAAQALVLFFTFLMGLGWGGATYVLGLLQALLAFGLIARLAARGRRAVVLVPVLSAALTAALVFAGTAYGRATACSADERAAVEQLAPPPGTTVEFEGEYVEGCLARTSMRLSSEAILEHYRGELARHGWRERPGRQEATVGTAAVKDGLLLVVDITAEGEGGAQTLELVVGDPRGPAPCEINTVDGFLERTPTTEVEPGNWVVLTSAVEQPGSVVVRDSTGDVVLDRRTQPQPQDDDDLMQLDEASDGFPTLALEEGTYSVECRPEEGAATLVPLQVGWASPAPDEPAKDVVLRIMEEPDDVR